MIQINIEHKEDLEINITQKQWKRWRQGTHIQFAMPQLNEDEREFLISGIAPEEWDKLFGDIEE